MINSNTIQTDQKLLATPQSSLEDFLAGLDKIEANIQAENDTDH
jgi:hypothetical protein